jgi:hypothetical protein
MGGVSLSLRSMRYWLLLLMVGLSAEGRAQSLPGLPALNLLQPSRLMAPGLTVGGETDFGNLRPDRRESPYHTAYVRATIPLRGRLAVGLDPAELLKTRRPLDLLDALRPEIRQRFLDLGLRYGTWFEEDAYLEAYLGASGLRYLGDRGFLLWSLRGRFSESKDLFGDYRAVPAVGLRVGASAGYARFARPGFLWYAGLRLGWDDGQWVPVPWAGFQAHHPGGHRVRVLLPTELRYAYRFGHREFLGVRPWELGVQGRASRERYGGPFRGLIFSDPVPQRVNNTLVEGRVGAWIGHLMPENRVWIQFHGGWVPFRRIGGRVAPGTTLQPGGAPAPRTPEFVWDALEANAYRGRAARPYLEVRIVADLGRDWLNLDPGALLMP